MILNITMTEEDYISASFLHLRPRPAFKWAGLVLVVLALVAVAAPFCTGAPRHIQFLVSASLASLIVYFAVAFFVWMPFRCRKTFRQQKTMQLPYTLDFTNECVITKAEYGEAKLTWDFFRKWKEGKTLFTLYQSDPIMQVVPKRVFASPGEMSAFRELLVRKIGPAEK